MGGMKNMDVVNILTRVQTTEVFIDRDEITKSFDFSSDERNRRLTLTRKPFM